MYLAKNIRFLRKRNGMSQEQVANAFGYDNYTTVQKWESDKSDPPLKVVKGLAELFGVGIDELVKIDIENKDILQADEEPASPPRVLRPDESHLLTDYNKLNDTGKGKVREYASDLTEQEKYIKSTGYYIA